MGARRGERLYMAYLIAGIPSPRTKCPDELWFAKRPASDRNYITLIPNNSADKTPARQFLGVPHRAPQKPGSSMRRLDYSIVAIWTWHCVATEGMRPQMLAAHRARVVEGFAIYPNRYLAELPTRDSNIT